MPRHWQGWAAERCIWYFNTSQSHSHERRGRKSKYCMLYSVLVSCTIYIGCIKMHRQRERTILSILVRQYTQVTPDNTASGRGSPHVWFLANQHRPGLGGRGRSVYDPVILRVCWASFLVLALLLSSSLHLSSLSLSLRRQNARESHSPCQLQVSACLARFGSSGTAPP